MAATEFKRGQTFAYAGQIKNNGAVMPFVGWSISAQLRTNYGMRLVQTFAASFLDPETGTVAITATDEETALWPMQLLLMDVRLEDPAGQVAISNTIEIAVVERITHA